MEKILNIIFGICSLLGLVVTFATLNGTLTQINLIADHNVLYENLAVIYKVLGISVVSLVCIFLIQSFLFNSHTSKLQVSLGELPIKNKHLEDVNVHLTNIINHHIRINRITTASIHNIAHYYRYITILLRDTVIDLRKEDSETDNDQCRKICNEFERYILSLLTSISSTLNVISSDECASCIKIINDNKVKTLYRDPASYRQRRNSDYTQNGKVFIYDISSNYAFNLIADDNSKETFFACDDLGKYSEYYNRNPEWKKLYNATIVVPIQANLSGDKRIKKMHLLGFLCCDNMRGGFENKEVKDFLSATGDLLYNLFILYDRFYLLSNDKELSNETLRDYDYWENC